MFINTLVIKKNDRIVREVNFHRGVNLIVGKKTNSKQSTNDLGKTTCIDAIDFCLGHKEYSIFYANKEFPESHNKQVKSFLESGYVSFDLQIESVDKKIFNIQRIIQNDNNKIKIVNKIDDKSYKNDFLEELNKIFFNNTYKKPTFRNLIHKFIRNEVNSCENILNFFSRKPTNIGANISHLLLFGNIKTELYDVIENSKSLSTNCKKQQQFIKSQFDIKSFEAQIKDLEEEIKELETKRNTFDIPIDYESEKRDISELENKINQINIQIINSNSIIKIDKKRVEDLRNSLDSIDQKVIHALYQEAKFYNEKLSKNFDNLIAFHNAMTNDEINFLDNKITKYENNLIKLNLELQNIKPKYDKLVHFFEDKGMLKNFVQLSEKVESKKEELTKLKEKYQQYNFWTEQLNVANNEIKDFNSYIVNKKSEINFAIEKFNNYFGKYSKELLGKTYSLSNISNDFNVDKYKFNINNLNGGMGSGKNKLIILLFDLAYTQYCHDNKIQAPLFSTIDKIEQSDIDKLIKIFHLNQDDSFQIIVPIIYDKINSITNEQYKKWKILELSEDEKFFIFEDN